MPFCFRARFIREQLQPRTSTIESETNSGPKLRQHSMILTVQLQGYVNSKCFLLAVPWSRIVNHDTICQFIYLLFNSSVFYDLFRPCFIKQLETMRRFDNKLTTKHLENKHSFGQSFLMKHYVNISGSGFVNMKGNQYLESHSYCWMVFLFVNNISVDRY